MVYKIFRKINIIKTEVRLEPWDSVKLLSNKLSINDNRTFGDEKFIPL